MCTTVNFAGSSPIDGWHATATRALQEADASGTFVVVMTRIRTLFPHQPSNAKASGKFQITALFIQSAARFQTRGFEMFPRLVGRYCSYLLPKQALATFRINATKHFNRLNEKCCIYRIRGIFWSYVSVSNFHILCSPPM